MEATSARYAARDRWGEPAQPAPSQLLRFIQSACNPENYEPNLALNLEIADLINAKKGSAPREAAMAIVGYINHRNPNVALLALSLLDICVKNCGYPFHLQISTKDFLNELVRRFPERPPPRPTRVQTRILGAIEEWRGTICETSRYKEDLGFIRDMHRLLSYKGYTFPEVRREDAAVLNPSDNLKSAEEMEEEEREAQSAKLQELIRRGTPEDLQEANRLMKIMAGYDTRSKVDYRAKAAEDVARIQQKARLLEERLAAFQQGDTMTEGDVFSELAASLSSAQPKIQKMCEEESDDHEAVARLLEINDSIHRTVERYKLLKKGDIAAAAAIAQGGPIPSAGSSRAKPLTGADAELSLIDFDGDGGDGGGGNANNASATAFTSSAPAPSAHASTGLENDLLGLSFNEPVPNFGQPGGIALGFGANSNVPGPALLSSVTQGSTAKGSLPTPSPPPAASAAFPSVFSPFSSAPSATSQSSSPQPPSSAFSTPHPPASADPFAALSSPAFRKSASPAQAMAASRPPPAPAPAPTAAAAADDDEWSFSSALPPEAPAAAPVLPQDHREVACAGPVKIELVAKRTPEAPMAITFAFAFSNMTAEPVTDVHFQSAVTKGYELQLHVQSGRMLAPLQSRGITQMMLVWHSHDHTRKVASVRLRWRLAYKLGGKPMNASGEVHEFELA